MSRRASERAQARLESAEAALVEQQRVFTRRVEAFGRRQAKVTPLEEVVRVGRRIARGLEELIKFKHKRVSSSCPFLLSDLELTLYTYRPV
jgi:hypothetical protein